MMSRRGSTDEQLFGRLLAPPDLGDGVESLGFWSRRSRRLPWYRIRARREAIRMTVRWEQRVGAALVSQHRAPPEARVFASALVALDPPGAMDPTRRIAVLAAVTAVVVLPTVSTVTTGLRAPRDEPALCGPRGRRVPRPPRDGGLANTSGFSNDNQTGET